MGLINWVLSIIVKLINSLLPVFGLPVEFTDIIDGALTIIIDLINGAAYFLPIDVMLVCWSVLLLMDSWILLFRIGQWVIKLIRG